MSKIKLILILTIFAVVKSEIPATCWTQNKQCLGRLIRVIKNYFLFYKYCLISNGLRSVLSQIEQPALTNAKKMGTVNGSHIMPLIILAILTKLATRPWTVTDLNLPQRIATVPPLYNRWLPQCRSL